MLTKEQRKENARAYQRKWRAENAERVSANNKAYREANLEQLRAKGRQRMKQYRADSPDKVQSRKAKWKAKNPGKVRAESSRHYATYGGNKRCREHAWRRLGIEAFTLEKFNAMAEEQHHTCAICSRGNTRSGKPISLAVDHDHTTGEACGLLCTGCNRHLGQIERRGFSGPHKCSVTFMAKAFLYLLTASLKRVRNRAA